MTYSQKYEVTKNYSYNVDIFNSYKKYEHYVSKLNISNDTKKWRLKHIRGFLYYLDTNHIKMQNIKLLDIYDYFETLETYSARTKEHRAICIRMFLNYMFKSKIINLNGNKVLPNIKCFKEATLPSYYSNEEIKKIIYSVKNKEINGKRDLAIILLFAKLGLRPRDVQYLKLENILWSDNKIMIIQSKTNWINVLPMDNDIRYALIDYIKNERPQVDSKYIFVKEDNTQFGDHFYYKLVNKYILKSKIEINNRRHGPYIFRHSQAYSLLETGNSLNEVSNLLGHRSTISSKAYLKLNYKDLKKISLEVPLCKN